MPVSLPLKGSDCNYSVVKEQLPRPVDSKTAKAKWDSSKSTLEIRLDLGFPRAPREIFKIFMVRALTVSKKFFKTFMFRVLMGPRKIFQNFYRPCVQENPDFKIF